MNKLLFAISGLLAFTCFFSCKKSSVNLSSIRIATVDVTTGGQTTHYRIVYGAGNAVDSIIESGGGNGFMYFNYFGTSYSITDALGNTYDVYANEAGQILKVLEPDTLTFDYNNSQLSEVDEQLSSGILNKYYYTWQNGDVSAISGPATSDIYSYNTGKGGQAGDAIRIGQFLVYGRSFTKTAHLPEGITFSDSTQQKYYYQFDGSGRISQLQFVSIYGPGSTDTSIYRYTYY
jgi:hypothetical protein